MSTTNSSFLIGKTYSGSLPFSFYIGGRSYKKGESIVFTVSAIHPQRYETGTVGLEVQVGDYPYLQTLIEFSPSDCVLQDGE